MNHIDDELLRQITHRLVEQFHPEQVILFGSRVWGMPNAGSDVDFMVIIPHSDLQSMNVVYWDTAASQD